MTRPGIPPRDDTVTIQARPGRVCCAYCGAPAPATGRRRYCGRACQQAAYRARATPQPAPPPLPDRQPRRPVTVYMCAGCGTRTLGQQRCDECGLFATAAGPGGHCPCCDEAVAYSELTR